MEEGEARSSTAGILGQSRLTARRGVGRLPGWWWRSVFVWQERPQQRAPCARAEVVREHLQPVAQVLRPGRILAGGLEDAKAAGRQPAPVGVGGRRAGRAVCLQS